LRNPERVEQLIGLLLRFWAHDATMWDREALDVYTDVFRDPAHASRAKSSFRKAWTP